MEAIEEEPRPSKAARLEAFLGRWVVTGSIEAPDSRAGVDGHWSFQPAIDGYGVLGIMLTTIDGLGTLEETALIGLDARTDQVHMVSANRFGIRDHVGDWVKTHRLVVEFSRSDENGQVSEEIVVDFDPPERIAARAVDREHGTVVATTDLTLVRAGANHVAPRTG